MKDTRIKIDPRSPRAGNIGVDCARISAFGTGLFRLYASGRTADGTASRKLWLLRSFASISLPLRVHGIGCHDRLPFFPVKRTPPILTTRVIWPLELARKPGGRHKQNPDPLRLESGTHRAVRYSFRLFSLRLCNCRLGILHRGLDAGRIRCTTIRNNRQQ